MNKSLKKNTVLNILKTISSIIFPLIIFPYVSRVLQPDNIGKVNFSSSFISYFTLIAGLGVLTYAVRECAMVKNDRKALGLIASQIFSINLITTLLAYLLLFVCLVFFKDLYDYRNIILIYSTVILFTTLGADWLNTATEDFKYITIRTIVFQILAIIAVFIFVRNSSDYIIFALIMVLSQSGASILNVWYRRKYCDIKFTFKMNAKKHLPPILILFVMSLSQVIFNNTDITMLGLMKGDYEVGLYSTAYKITVLIATVVQSVILVLLPRLSEHFSNNDFESFNKLLRKLLAFNLILGLPFVVGTIMLADEAMYIIGGDAFVPAANILRIQILAFMFSLVGGSFLGNGILIPLKQEKYYMKVCLVTAGINVCLNYLLIPVLSTIGSAIATAVNGFFILVFLLFKIDKRVKIENLIEVFFGPICGCFVIALVCIVIKSLIVNVIVRIAICITISSAAYFLVLYLLRNSFIRELITIYKAKIRS